MRQTKVLISAFIFFGLLMVSDFTMHYIFHESTFERYERCLDRKDVLSGSANFCSEVNSAAVAAFSSATSNHIVTYFAIFMTFVILGLKLDKTEKRLKELEDRTNV